MYVTLFYIDSVGPVETMGELVHVYMQSVVYICTSHPVLTNGSWLCQRHFTGFISSTL